MRHSLSRKPRRKKRGHCRPDSRLLEDLLIETTWELFVNGGEGGIRTHDTLAGMPHFECGAFDHSATSPHARTLALRAPLKHQWRD